MLTLSLPFANLPRFSLVHMASAHSAVAGLGVYSINNLLVRILCRCPQESKNYLTHNHNVPVILQNCQDFRLLAAADLTDVSLIS